MPFIATKQALLKQRQSGMSLGFLPRSILFRLLPFRASRLQVSRYPAFSRTEIRLKRLAECEYLESCIKNFEQYFFRTFSHCRKRIVGRGHKSAALLLRARLVPTTKQSTKKASGLMFRRRAQRRLRLKCFCRRLKICRQNTELPLNAVVQENF